MSDGEDDRLVGFMIRDMPKEVKDDITLYARRQGMKNAQFLENLLGLFESLTGMAQRGDTTSEAARRLLEINGFSHLTEIAEEREDDT